VCNDPLDSGTHSPYPNRVFKYAALFRSGRAVAIECSSAKLYLRQTMPTNSSELSGALQRLESQIRAAEKLLSNTPGATLEGVSAHLLQFFDGRIRFDGNTPLWELPVKERLEAATHLPELIRKARAAEPELVAKADAAAEAIEKAIAETQS
jgi:hypothetical protein